MKRRRKGKVTGKWKKYYLMAMSETKRREKPSQSMSLPFLEGRGCEQFFASLQISFGLWKAAKEKAAISIKMQVSPINTLFIEFAVLMALVLE
jgi:hypothetical protein